MTPPMLSSSWSADEHVDHAAGGLGLGLETHQDVHDLAGVRAPVHDIACLHKVGVAGAPVEILVDEPRAPEDGDEVVIVAVQVPDDDDPADVRPNARDRLGV